MKIFKIAQGVPAGKIKMKLRVNKKTGAFKIEVTGHDGKITCADGLDESIIRDLLESEIGGIGSVMGEDAESGTTSLYLDEMRKRTAVPAKPTEDAPELLNTEAPSKLDTGFGV